MQRSPKIVCFLGLLLTFALPTAAVAQEGHPSTQPNAAQNEVPMIDRIAELRAEVARLEASLQQNHEGTSTRSHTTSTHPDMAKPMGMEGMGMDKDKGKGMQKKGMDGMAKMGGQGTADTDEADGMSAMKSDPSNGMGMGGMKMGMQKARGMKMMGMKKRAASTQASAMNSALPGFPGASHIYHIGATGFFLDHEDHIELTTEQQSVLSRYEEKSLLAQNTADRNIEDAEQQLWELTAADEPDAALIEGKIRELEKLRGDQRLDFIRAVGEAAGVLTADQRQTLLGQDSQTPAGDAAQHQH